ncbi:thiol peroxidase [Seonamhaeicola sp. NFXS20]|uniref:thiol peroxidase n=1 Tax=unclassified Seonamhaeicola TaxID=2622645 RepID=UPI00356AA1B0
MATVTLKGNTINTSGELPKVGTKAPDFTLTATDLSSKTLNDFSGSRVVLNIFPSVDTGTCAASVRQFNTEASELENTKVLCISKDLPFALARFCGAEGLDNVVSLSDFKTGDFGTSYGVNFVDGPLESLLSRSVVVLDENGTILYTEQVAETTEEPNYKAALEVLY